MTPWISSLAAAALVVSAGAHAEENRAPAPSGATLLLETIADGVQVYACEAKDQRFAWAFKQPEAALYDRGGRQIGIHFHGPTWKLDDGSAVIGELAARADAPDAKSIPWLLLRAKH